MAGRVAVVMVVLVAAALLGPRASSAPETSRVVRVATFNIHKGANRAGHYDLLRTIDAMHRLGADVIGVQEAMRHHPEFACDDQPALLAEGLRRRTGQPWTHVRAGAWMLDERRCAARAQGEAATEDLVVLAASPILSSGSVRLSEGRIGLAVRVAAMPDLPVVVTHLTPNRSNQADRLREIGLLLPWTARYGPGLLIGDLNAQPDAAELAPLRERYRDAWAESAALGRVRGIASGSTRPGSRVSRIDYVLYEPAIGWTLESAEVVDVSALSANGEVSDHHPVVATFRRTGR